MLSCLKTSRNSTGAVNSILDHTSKVDSDEYPAVPSSLAELIPHCILRANFELKSPTRLPKGSLFCGVGSRELSITEIFPMAFL